MANRRDFLKQSAAAAAALYWFPKLVSGSPSSGANGSVELTTGQYPINLASYSALNKDYGSVEIIVSSPYTRFRLTRIPGPKYYAVDEICTHQGCTIGAYNSSSHYFQCPCHQARFNADGTVIRVAPRPLATYAVTVVDSNNLTVAIPGYVSVQPVEIASFGGAFLADHVELTWTTASEMDNAGFLFDRRIVGDEAWAQITPSLIPGHGTTSNANNYGFSDRNILRGKIYEYRLRQIDRDGVEHAVRQTAVAIPIGGYKLSQNFPDPFSTTTQWTYSLTHADHVMIVISDMNGSAVRTLVDAQLAAQEYPLTWDGRDRYGSNVPSGTYIITMRTSGGVLSRTVQVAR